MRRLRNQKKIKKSEQKFNQKDDNINDQIFDKDSGIRQNSSSTLKQVNLDPSINIDDSISNYTYEIESTVSGPDGKSKRKKKKKKSKKFTRSFINLFNGSKRSLNEAYSVIKEEKQDQIESNKITKPQFLPSGQEKFKILLNIHDLYHKMEKTFPLFGCLEMTDIIGSDRKNDISASSDGTFKVEWSIKIEIISRVNTEKDVSNEPYSQQSRLVT